MARGGKPKPGTNTIPPVTGLIVTVLSANSIKLEWNAVPNATTYWIFRNGYTPAIVPQVTYIDTVASGTTYRYEIAAVVNSKLGPKSASVTVQTPK